MGPGWGRGGGGVGGEMHPKKSFKIKPLEMHFPALSGARFRNEFQFALFHVIMNTWSLIKNNIFEDYNVYCTMIILHEGIACTA